MKVIEHDLSVLLTVVCCVVGFVALLVWFAPVGFEVSRRWLFVIIVVEVGEDGMKGFGLVSKGNVMPSAFAFSCTTVGEEHDGDEVRKKGFDVGVLEELGISVERGKVGALDPRRMSWASRRGRSCLLYRRTMFWMVS